jgi:succinate dehydrogenase / fumarate reductase cytochrome b subunit
MSTAKPTARPLSPHLQVYRLPLAALLSISQRAAGIGLIFGILLLTWWVTAAAYGPDAYALVMDFLGSWIGIVILVGFSLALYLHLCAGLRHLIWDTGRGITNEATASTNLLVLLATAVLTAATWIWALR